jgi:isoprenylcysteine carboxyl methyltransferase (ICMT) family protein YpbQ
MERFLDTAAGDAQFAIGALLMLRLIEYTLARRNAETHATAGAVEYGRGNHQRVAILYGAWLFALTYAAVETRALWWPALIAFAPFLVLRLWTLRALGEDWRLRLFAPPPPAHLRRRMFWATLAEFALLPFAFGAWFLAPIFIAAGVWILRERAALEDRAATGAIPDEAP